MTSVHVVFLSAVSIHRVILSSLRLPHFFFGFFGMVFSKPVFASQRMDSSMLIMRKENQLVSGSVVIAAFCDQLFMSAVHDRLYAVVAVPQLRR